MKDAVKLINKILGETSAEFFEGQLDDFSCYVHSSALVSNSTSLPSIKEKMESIAHRIVEHTVRFFLIEKYGTNDDGNLRVIIEDNKIYDETGELVPEIPKLVKAKLKIIESLMDFAMEEFEKGLKLASEINHRITIHKEEEKAEKKTTKRQERDYGSWPAFEFIEIEILRLEKKLPQLSAEEGKRLCSLYERQHNQESLEQELMAYGGK